MSEYLKKKGYPRAFQPEVFGHTRFKFQRDYVLTAASGSFTETGTVASLLVGYRVTATSGAVTETGTDVSFTYTQPNAGILGTSGQRRNYPRAFQPAVFGKTAFFPTRDNSLSASPGSVTWNGTAANLLEGYAVTATSGNVAWNGTAATLSSNQVITNVIGYSEYQRKKNYPRAFQPEVFGKKTAFGFTNAYRLQADTVSFDWVGTSVNLGNATGALVSQIDRRFKVWPRAFAPNKKWGHLTTQVSRNRIGYATLSYAVLATGGSYAWTGTTANLLSGYRLTASGGAVSVNTNPATLNKGFTLTASAGAFTVTAANIKFNSTRVGLAGSFLITGTPVTFKLIPALTAASGSYTITGDVNTNLRYSAQATRGEILLLGVG
ncbi:MAG TPA: hypothetical protein VM577_13575 [Anaerovoracaceae bacterium]|nr:hypothetical protein [Anaerovoracaceae bacterium]